MINDFAKPSSCAGCGNLVHTVNVTKLGRQWFMAGLIEPMQSSFCNIDSTDMSTTTGTTTVLSKSHLSILMISGNTFTVQT